MISDYILFPLSFPLLTRTAVIPVPHFQPERLQPDEREAPDSSGIGCAPWRGSSLM